MQQSQRAAYNHALEYAIREANRFQQQLIVFFALTADFPEANRRHYVFMLEGLLETQKALHNRGITMIIEHCNPVDGVIKQALDASLVVTDMGYLRIQRAWRMKVSQAIHCQMIEIESDVIVPVSSVSPKEEYSAGTLRPKMLRILDQYLVPLHESNIVKDSLSFRYASSIKNKSIAGILSILNLDQSVREIDRVHGGTSSALDLFTIFTLKKLDHFGDLRNDPSLDYTSHLSPYLHFGQISPLHIALEIKKKRSAGTMSFLEELIIRRELSMNFVWYNRMYDTYESLPHWARATLELHKKDKREYVYTRDHLEHSQTHDPYWNAAQREMVVRGKMHGYMRMYWGKKIIEWTRSPHEAFSIALSLNNKYELDGRDANGFTGVAWCFGKHDRAWKERPIFGKVRFMNAAGLKRKFDIDAYVKKCSAYSL
jgi:deoxyribodipyrimidine photo-lyase